MLGRLMSWHRRRSLCSLTIVSPKNSPSPGAALCNMRSHMFVRPCQSRKLVGVEPRCCFRLGCEHPSRSHLERALAQRRSRPDRQLTSLHLTSSHATSPRRTAPHLPTSPPAVRRCYRARCSTIERVPHRVQPSPGPLAVRQLRLPSPPPNRHLVADTGPPRKRLVRSHSFGF